MRFNAVQDILICHAQIFLNLVNTDHTMPDIVAPFFEFWVKIILVNQV